MTAPLTKARREKEREAVAREILPCDSDLCDSSSASIKSCCYARAESVIEALDAVRSPSNHGVSVFDDRGGPTFAARPAPAAVRETAQPAALPPHERFEQRGNPIEWCERCRLEAERAAIAALEGDAPTAGWTAE